jgi:hypothetical protein
MLPATIYIVYGFKELDPLEWVDTNTTAENGGIDEAMLLRWV